MYQQIQRKNKYNKIIQRRKKEKGNDQPISPRFSYALVIEIIFQQVIKNTKEFVYCILFLIHLKGLRLGLVCAKKSINIL
jgi:hypothetical protein